MSIDMSKVQQLKTRLTQELSRGGGSQSLSARFWRPSDGDNIIRIMPSWTTEEPYAGQFWREVGQHWGVSDDQKGPVLCPKTTPDMSGECPICEFVNALKNDKNSIQALEMAKELRAKKAYLVNIVDLNDSVYTAKDVAEFKKSRPEVDVPFEAGDSKIQVYACPKTIFDLILNCIMQNDQDITDLKKGNDITINKSGRGVTGTRYTVTPKLKSTAADVDASTVLPALDRVGYVMAEGELMKLLRDGAGSSFPALLPAPSTTNTGEQNDEDLETQMSRALG